MDSQNIDRLFGIVVQLVEARSGTKLDSLRASLNSTLAKLRFVQYFISGIVGSAFLDELRGSTGITQDMSFSIGEAMRLFGPWNSRDISICHDTIFKLSGETVEGDISDLKSASIPLAVSKMESAECQEFVDNSGGDDQTLERNLVF